MHSVLAGPTLILVFLLTGPGAPSQAPPAATPTARRPAPGSAEYAIRPGDVVRIWVWKEPELSSEAFVRLDGKITAPLLGDLLAEGRTPNQLAEEIGTKLKRYVGEPQVTVTLAQANSQRFYVIGEVVSPGSFSLAGRTTVLQALALAGGFREFAKRDRIQIIRERGTTQTAIPFNYKEVQAGRSLKRNITLEAGDTILVP